MVEGIVGTVIGGIILAVLAWLWTRRGRLHGWLAGQVAEAKKSEQLTAEDELAAIRQQVIEVANEQGIEEAQSVTSGHPKIVTWTTGRRTPYYRDHPTYVREMKARRADIQSRHGSPPVPISHWDRERCQKWLDEHTV